MPVPAPRPPTLVAWLSDNLLIGIAAPIAIVIGAAAYGNLTPGFLNAANNSYFFYSLGAATAFLTTLLIILPIYSYIRYDFPLKRENIVGFLDSGLIEEYFNQFPIEPAEAASATASATAPKTPTEIFNDRIEEQFGKNAFAGSTPLLTAAAFFVLLLAAMGGINKALGQPTPNFYPLGLNISMVTIAAIAGCYTFVVTDVILKAHQKIIHPTDIRGYTLRFFIAVPLGQAIATMVAGTPVFAAFVISLFSLDSIIKYLTTALTKLGYPPQASDDERPDLVSALAGVDQEKTRTLRMEGISTISQLVAVDPVRLSIRSGLSFEYILRLVDAAILWNFFGQKTDSLRTMGIRGASDLLILDAAANPPAADAPPPAPPAKPLNFVWNDLEQAFNANPGPAGTAAAPIPALNQLGLNTALVQLRSDSYAKFIQKMLGP